MALSKRGKLTLRIVTIILAVLAVAGVITGIVLASLAAYKKVTLQYGEGQTVIFTVREDDTFGVPAENYKEGYTFDNWYIDQGCTVPFDFNSAIKDDITIYGKWNPSNTINFYSNDGTDTIFKVFENQDYEKPFAVPGEEPTREKYVFKGWSLTPQLNSESILYKFGTTNRAFEIPLHGISLYAIWERDEVTIKYDFNGAKIDGRESKEFVLDRNSEHDIQSLNPKLDGHTFIGWSEDKFYIEGTSVLYQAADFIREDGQPPINPKFYATNNTILYAVFRQHKITVTFDANTTEPYVGEVPDIIAPFNRPVLIPSTVYERDGYSLYGWSEDPDFELGVDDTFVYTPGGWFTYGAIFQDDQTVPLYAIWVVKTVEIVFDFGEGTGTLRGIPYKSTEYITSAQYNANFTVPNFHVEYKTPTPFFVGFAAELTPDPITGRPRKSEIFYPESTIMINGDMVLVKPDGTLKVVIEAQYQNSTIFEVDYELNGGVTAGGSNRLPTTYVDFPPGVGETTVITLPTLTKKGNSFVGWTTVNGKEGTKIQDIDEYAEGIQYNVDRNITLYAYFVPFGYNVKYHGNGETNGYVADNNTYYYGDTIPLARCTYEKTGFTFVGWALEAEGPAKFTESGTFNFPLEDGVNPDFILGLYQPGSTIEFYAIWETRKYSITLPTGEGYTIRPVDGSMSPVEFGGEFTFEFEFAEGYEKGGANIYVNGVEVSLTDWRYTIQNIKTDVEVTVSGVRINTLSVTLPEDDRIIAEAYGVSVGVTNVDYNGSYLFRITLLEPYTQSTIIVKTTDSNGRVKTLEGTNGVYLIQNIIYDQTISVEGIEKNKYSVTLIGGTGYILETEDGSYTATVEHGDSLTFRFILDERYNLSPFALLVNEAEIINYDQVQTDSTGYLGFLEDIRNDKTITVTGVTINTYTVTLASGTGYTLTAKSGSSSPCNHGDSYTFKFALDAAYSESLYTVYVNGEAVVLNADKEYTIANIKKNISVTVDGITKNRYDVTLPTSDMQIGYTLTAEGSTNVEYGDNLTIVFGLKPGYTKSSYVIRVGGEEVTLNAQNKYTITNITSNLSVSVSGVELNTYKITYLPQPQWTGYTFNFWSGNPNPAAIPYGEDFVFSFSIKTGYDTRDVEVYVIKYDDDGVEIERTDVYDIIVANGGQYTIGNITTDLELVVEGIKTINWNVRVVEPIEGFEVKYLYGYSDKVPSGNDLEFVVELEEAYSLSFPLVYVNSVLVNPVRKECKYAEDDTPVERDVYKVTNVIEDQFITVVGVTKNSYQVVIPSSPAYKITPVTGDPTNITYGGTFAFKVEVSNAYSLSASNLKVFVNATRVNSVSGVYTISNITQGQRITIEGLEVNTYNISFANQSVVASYFDIFGAVTGQSMVVEYGETFTFELQLKAEYNQSPLSVTVKNDNGDDVEIPHSGITYILSDVRKNHVISISGMEINRYQVALPMGAGYVAKYDSGNDAEGKVQHGGTVKFYYYVLPLYSDSADQAVIVLNGVRIRPEIQKSYPDLNLTIEEKSWMVDDIVTPGVTTECHGYLFTVSPVETRYQLAISGFKGNTYSVDLEVGLGYKYVNEADEEFSFFEAAQDSTTGGGTDCLKFKVVLEEKYNKSEIAVIRTDINGDVFTLEADADGFYSLIDISKHCTISVLDVVVNTYKMKMPETTPGYDIEIRNTSTNPVEYGQSFGFYIKLDTAYTKSAVKVYAKDLETSTVTEVRVSSGIYIIRNITKEYEIIVEGVEINEYTIYTPATQEGYTLLPEDGQASVVKYGESFTFNFALLEGYTDSEYLILVNGEIIDQTQIVNGKCTISNITDDQLITVTGVVLNVYSMTMPTGEGYLVTILNGTKDVTHGKPLSFKITFEDAYKESESLVHVYYAPTNDLSNEDEVVKYGGIYTIPNVTEPLTVKVVGVSVSVYTVEFPSETTGYEITSLSGTDMTVVYGNSFSFTVVLDEIYSNSSIMVKTNGVFLSPDPTTGVYTISNIKAHQVITVDNVKINTYKVTLITGAGYMYEPITAGYTIDHGSSYEFKLTILEGYDQSIFTVNHRKTGETGTPQVLQLTDSRYILENITEDKDIFVTGVVLNTYTVTYPQEMNQGFLVAPVDGTNTVIHGQAFRFVVQLEDKYNKSNFKVFANGTEVSATAGQYILSDVRQDVTVELTGIEVNTYTITYPASQVGYTITTVSGYTTPVKYGENFRFTFVLDEAYSNSAAVRIISVNGAPVSLSGDVCELTNITEDKVITVTGVTKNIYNVTLATGEGYSLVPVSGSESPVEWGGSYAFKFVLKPEYNQSEYDVLLNDVSIKNDLLEGGYTITNIKEHKNVTVTGVMRNNYTINLPTGIEGCEIVSANASNKVEHGGNFSFRVNLMPAYSNAEIVVKSNGVSIYELGGEFTIKNITENQNVEISGVTKNKYTITLKTGEGYNLTAKDGVVPSYVEYGDNFTFAFSIKEGYTQSVPVVSVNGSQVQLNAAGEFQIQHIDENIIVSVDGVKLNKYNITLPTEQTGYMLTHGTGNSSPVLHGHNYTFTFALSNAYSKSDATIRVNGEEVILNNGEYTITNVTEDKVITVENVTLNTYQIIFPDAADQEGYTLTRITGTGVVDYGSSVVFTFVLDVSYDRSDYIVRVNGLNTPVVFNEFTIENITNDKVITVEGVVINEYTISLPPNQIGYELKAHTGSASPIKHGGNFTMKFTLLEGYDQSIPNLRIRLDGEEIQGELDADGLYTLKNVDNDHVLTVEGVKINIYSVVYIYYLGADEQRVELTVTHGGNIPASDIPNPEGRIGYNFLGWTDVSTNIKSNKTIVANYQIKTYEIIWSAENADAGSNTWGYRENYTTSDEKFAVSVVVYNNMYASFNGGMDPALITPIRTGYTFDGWYTAKIGGTQVQTYTLVGDIPNRTTYYARWLAIGITVVFDANGGEGTPPTQNGALFNHGNKVTSDAGGFVRSRYTFVGWNLNKNANTGSNSYTVNIADAKREGEEYLLTLYAIWKRDTVTITFNANGGANPPEPTVVNTFEYLILTDAYAATRTGLTFYGWCENENGTGTIYSKDFGVDRITVENTNIIVYAIWAYEINYNKNFPGEEEVKTKYSIINKSYQLETVFSVDYYTFVGWAITADGEVKYADKYVFEPLQQNLDLYGIWIAGYGTADVPFKVSSIDDWNDVVNYYAANDTIYYQQTEDIVETEELRLIRVKEFAGQYDGNNKKITLFDGCAPIDKVMGTAKVKDLEVIANNVYFKTYSYFGGICLNLYGILENCKNTTDMEITVTSTLYLGGLTAIAYNGSKIINSSNTGSFTVAGKNESYIGGLAGYSDGGVVIENSTNSGNITTTSTSGVAHHVSIGGAVGYLGTTSINSVDTFNNTGSFTATNCVSDIGGVIGYAYNTARLTMNNVYNTGAISTNATTRHNIGGILGGGGTAVVLEVTNAYNEGSLHAISASGSNYYTSVGGIVGLMDKNTSVTITKCYNLGLIDASGLYESYFGGIIGISSAGLTTITECYNTGDIVRTTGYTGYYGSVGGLFGKTGTLTLTKSFNIGNIDMTWSSGSVNVGGLGGNAGDNTNIDSCYNTGIVRGICTYNGGTIQIRIDAGGLFGYFASGTIKKSYNSGYVNVRTISGAYVGGIAGIANKLTLSNSYNIADVNVNSGRTAVESDYYILEGGIIGYLTQEISLTHVYNAGAVNLTASNLESQSISTGGLIGRREGSVFNLTNVGWANDVSGDIRSGIRSDVTGYDTTNTGNSEANIMALIKNTSTALYSGWDKINTWTFDTTINNGLPTLRVANRITYDKVVTFNSNYGTATTTTTKVAENTTALMPTNVFARTGYTIIGWSTDPSATTVEYDTNESVLITENTTFYAVWAKGDGSSANPYEISNANLWNEFVFNKALIPGVCYKQTANISSTLGVNGVMKQAWDFYGIYDGGNYTITLGGSSLGLFKTLRPSSEIKNLKLVHNGALASYPSSVSIGGEGYYSSRRGGFASESWGSINNCSWTVASIGAFGVNNTFFTGLVAVLNNGSSVSNTTVEFRNSTSDAEFIYMGGIAGQVSGTTTITNCSVKGNAMFSIVRTEAHVGGLVGLVSGGTVTISNSKNMLDVNIPATGATFVGGLVGNATGGTLSISSSYNSGNIVTTSANSVPRAGGLIGRAATSTTISNCYNASFVDSACTTSNPLSGGLVADAPTTSLTISNSYNIGSVASSATSGISVVGGLIGYASGYVIKDSFNMGGVIVTSNTAAYAAGIIGSQNLSASSSIRNVYAAGRLKSDSSNRKFGAIIAQNAGSSTLSVYNTYWIDNIVVSAIQEDEEIDFYYGGSQAGASEMKYSQMYANLKDLSSDFYTTNATTSWNSSVWKSNETFNNGIPYLVITDETNTFDVPITFVDNVRGNLNVVHKVAYGSSYVTSDTIFTSTGFTLVGWAEISGEEHKYENYGLLYDLKEPQTLYAVWYRGDGSEAYPYEIKDLDTWERFVVGKSAFSGLYFKQVTNLTDIQGDEEQDFSMVEEFHGVYDGNGMTYTIGGANPFKHVFGTIKNLNVTSSGRSYTETGIAQHIGGIVTVLETGGRIENCTMNGAITATYKGSDGAYVGGLVAYVKGNSSSIVGCENYASITANGASLKYVGGLVGAFDISVQSTLSIDTSINFANINVSSGSKVAYVGGLVGGCDQDNLKAHAINITNCYNIGTIDVTSTGQQSVGGLFGRFEDENHATSITILNSYNAGFVNTSTTKQTHLGGLVGYGDKITIKNSFNIGKLYGYIDTSVAINLGGLVGYAYNSTTGNTITIEHSYNAGIINYVSGSSANKVGGLVGHLKSKDSNYNIGTTNYYVTNMGTAMGTAVGSKTVVTGSGRFDELYAKLKTPGESIYSTWSSSVWKRNQIYNNGLPFFATQPADTSTFTVEIKFNKGSGSGTMQSLYVYENSMFIAPKCTFSAPSGYYFEGWMTIPDGEEMEFGENSFVKNLSSNITLYPYWAEE